MDELNNAPNPFNEDNSGKAADSGQPDQYNMPYADPYNQQPTQNAEQYNPYSQQTQQNAGQQQYNPYGQQQYNMPQNGQQQYNMPQNGQYQQNTYQPNGQQQGYYQPQGYGMPYPYSQQSTGMAVASLVLGIISITTGLFMFAFPFLFLMPIIGIILGIVFKTKKYSVGKGLSTAGIITSVIGLIIPLILLIVVMVMLVTNGAEIMDFLKQYSPEDYNELYEMYGDQFPEWFSSIMMFFRG